MRVKILRLTNLKEFFATLEMSRKIHIHEKDLTDEARLEEITEYLKKPRNRKIYERHLERLNDAPKSLVLYPSWGFKGYLQKIMNLIPK